MSELYEFYEKHKLPKLIKRIQSESKYPHTDESVINISEIFLNTKSNPPGNMMHQNAVFGSRAAKLQDGRDLAFEKLAGVDQHRNRTPGSSLQIQEACVHW